MKQIIFRVLSTLLLTLAVARCSGEIESDGKGGSDDNIPVDRTELVGAGGRDVTTDWPSQGVPFANNTKVLSFSMLRNEVTRAVGRSWLRSGADQWESNRTVLGGADYKVSWVEDRSINQQKIMTVRQMASAVCADLVTAEIASRTVFIHVDPNQQIDVNQSAVVEQIKHLFVRIILEPASDVEVADAKALLADLQTQGTPRRAWEGLCASYLASTRFLSY